MVPTLDGALLKIDAAGTIVPLLDLAAVDLGIPFAIAEHNGDWIVTVSSYTSAHHLVRVRPNGTYTQIADLSDASGEYGAPFGVAVRNDDYLVTLSTDTIEATGVLLKVTASGEISDIANLAGGNPFGVVVDGCDCVVAQSKGQLVRVSSIGKQSAIVDLKQAGFGIPLGIALQKDDLFVGTNLGLIVRVDRLGNVKIVANLLKARFGIPAGLALSQNNLIATTNSGYLLRIS